MNAMVAIKVKLIIFKLFNTWNLKWKNSYL